MRQAVNLFLFGCSLFLLPAANAQPDRMTGNPAGSSGTGRPDMEFGNVTPETFASSVYEPDSSANAVILFDKGIVSYDPRYQNNGYCVIFERHTRIRILNKNALGLSSFSLSTYRKGGYASPSLEDFKGVTYNMEDGRLVTTRLDKSNIFKDRNSNFDVEKIAFPNVKEGSVIEYSFRIVYPGYGYIPQWQFQGGYPELWSEYDITVPGLFEYFVKTQGYQPFVMDTTLRSTDQFYIGFAPGGTMPAFHGTWSGETVRRVWAQRNIPALEKREPYTTTLSNHIGKVEFQLSGVRLDGYTRTFRSTWEELSKELQKSDNFGSQLTDHNRWMDDALGTITSGDKTSPEAARRIFVYVRDHFNGTAQESIWLSRPLKKTWEDKAGNVADINLLLTAVYKHQGFDATPVILSTRGHGVVLDIYPLLNEYNYVITRLRLNGKEYLLDASKAYTGFGSLPEMCYNGVARAIDDSYAPIALQPDSLKEIRRTFVTLSNTDSGFYGGRFERFLGTFESMSLRSQLKKEKEEDFFENLHKSMPDSKEITDYGFDSLNVQEEPLEWHYNMKYRFTAKRFYFNPLIHERYTNNPFNSPERHYPVEMPYCTNHFYTLRMEVPKGYVVEQLPKSKRILLEDGSGFFEYLIQQDGDVINLRTELRLGKATYPVDEYQGLRGFYSMVVEKEKEPIIFKKIN